ncbi:DUF5677 domain-containing protein [Paraburkholderia dipogonis]|uniref:DUF5677 domain-containing protein n=1 Tax=Paraburkholderia dipogonis TaxID=1211383 RepID=UPI0038BB7058
MTSIETDGFLSPKIQDFRAHLRTQFRDLVSECEDVSRRATTQLFGESVTAPTIPRVMAASLWARCLSNCQAAILLAERGMGLDALALLRTGYENLFYFVALIKRPTAIARLADEDTRQRIKQATEMLRDAQIVAALSVEDRERLEAFLRDTPAPTKSISAFEAAEIAEMTGVYQAAWRTFSLMAAHSTLTAAGFAFGKDLLDLQFGPSFEHVDAALGLARDCIRLGLDAVAPLFTAGNDEQRA